MPSARPEESASPKPGKPRLACRAIPGGVAFDVVVSAGASRSGVRGLHGGALKLSVRAAPEKGKANAEVIEVLAEWLGVARKQVRIAGGETSRNKRVEASGVSAEGLQARVAELK